jgi:CubicO group peptidase (beta-lactamase class C family)
MKKRYIILILLPTILIIYLALPQNKYLRKALIYQTVDIDDYKIFENRTISNGKHQPWMLAANYNKKAIPEKYLNFFSDLQTVAFLVIKDTAIVHESYYRGYNSESVSNSFSMAKSIVGLLVGCALDDGSIKSLDQKVSEFIPEFNTESNKLLTIRNLLTMSSGLNWDERYKSPFSLTTKAYYGEDLNSLIKDLKVIEKPGVQFKYLSGNTQILSFIIEKATGKNLSTYASEKLWKPLGAQNNALWSLDKANGVEKAYCCFNSNARDFARFGQLILNKGKWQGKQLVSEKYIEQATSPASELINEYGQKPLDYYGYHWWIMEYRNHKVTYMRGVLGQYVFVIPDLNMVIVRLGEKRCSLKTHNIPSDIYVDLNLAMELIEKQEPRTKNQE